MHSLRSIQKTSSGTRTTARFNAWILGVLTLFAVSFAFPAIVQAETRTLNMYFTHTKKSAKITFKRNGRYVKSGLRKANKFLGDWRRKESTKMDPALLDLVWEVYQKSGSRKKIHVISGYRSPRTNNMLRRRGRKVARKSQHTRGKALDFFMPDVSVKKLRALGLKAHRGGVGYYRGSFVHLDTGNVRHWPRMSRRQLARVFPRGKTIHVPSNGKALRGYKTAKANLERGLNADGSKRTTAVRKTLLARLFTRSTAAGGDEDESAASVRKPARAVAKPVAKKKPAPKPKPAVDPFASDTKSVAAAAAQRAADEKKKAAELKLAEEKKRKAEKLLADERKKEDDLLRKQKKEADEAKAIALAAAAEEALKKQQEQVALAELGRVAVPRQRPQLRTETTTLALAPVDASTINAQSAANATQLALATPSQAPRPPLAVGNVKKRAKQIDALRNRVQSAIAAQPALGSLVSASSAPLPTTVPTSAKRRVIAAADLTLPAKPFQPETLAVPVPRIEAPKPTEQPVLQASLTTETKAPKPSYRLPSELNAKTVPNPQPQKRIAAKRPQANSRAIALESGEAMQPELSLGDLDGRAVKSWAVATSTRIGSSAVLEAPIYSESTKRAAPASIYAVGFADATSPLRADRFSGRALTRVAFANFN